MDGAADHEVAELPLERTEDRDAVDGQAYCQLAGRGGRTGRFDDGVLHRGVPVAAGARKRSDLRGDRAGIRPGPGARLFAGPIGDEERQGTNQAQISGLGDGVVHLNSEDRRSGGLGARRENEGGGRDGERSGD